jgi:hypothetical protein
MKVIVFANHPPEFWYKKNEFAKPQKRLSLDRWKVFLITRSLYHK